MTHAADPVAVERLRPAKASEAAVVVTASHANYPAFRQLFPDPAARRRALHVFMAASITDAGRHGHALVARDQHGMLGVALWMPPGTFPPSGMRIIRMTPGLLRVALAAPRAFRTHMRVGSALMNAHPTEPSWYLQAMGVHPRAQRRGVGRQLMRPGLTLADEANLPCYLQTSDSANIDYYRRYGFEVSQPAIETLPDGPTYIGMTRPPASS